MPYQPIIDTERLKKLWILKESTGEPIIHIIKRALDELFVKIEMKVSFDKLEGGIYKEEPYLRR